MSVFISMVEFADAFSDLVRDQAEWSQATFGTDQERGPLGALKHLEKEAREAQEAARTINECRANGVADNPISADPVGGWRDSALLVELADCLLLLLDASRRAGVKPMELVRAAQRKMEVNKSRQWPKPTDDQPVEHVK